MVRSSLDLLRRFHRRGLSHWRSFWLRQRGISVARHVEIQPGARIRRLLSRNALGEISLGESVQIAQGAIVESWGGDIRIGDRVYMGPYSIIYGHGGVTIGDDTLIAMHCCILSSNHQIPSSSEIIQRQPDELLPTRIGKDVWLGAHVTILGGVTIGDGCVVGAGAVVTKDLPPYSIATGVPAKVQGQRPRSPLPNP